MIFSLLFALAAHAGPSPCQFVTTLSEKPVVFAYDIGKAYSAATLVAVGRADVYKLNGGPQIVKISRVIKGPAVTEIKLEGFHQSGTAPWGTAIDSGKDTLIGSELGESRAPIFP
jgi:hypothetical protein